MKDEKQMTIRLIDIAKKLNMGVSTVSEVLGDKKNCFASESNKELIRKTAREMGYIPNRMSRGMRGLPTNTIGIIGSFFSVPVISLMIDVFNSLIEKNGYFAMLGDSREEAEREKTIIREFLSRGVDGLLIQSYLDKSTLEEVIAQRVPYICYNLKFEGMNVTVDRRDGAFMVVDHLISQHAHKRIGFVYNRMETNLEKLTGYQKALTEHNIPLSDELLIKLSSKCAGVEALKPIAEQKIDAVFCTNDFIAGHLIKELKLSGRRVPEDVAVVGFDGLDIICDMIQPSLTSIRQPVEKAAELTVQLLMKKLNGQKVEEKIHYIKPTLRIGKSCGCP